MVSLKGGELFRKTMTQFENVDTSVTLEVGFLPGARYPTAEGTSVPLVAALNEYGVPSHNQPPRPYFRNMIAEKSPTWPKAIADLLQDNDYDVGATMTLVGHGIKKQLQDSINTLTSPPLSPVTIAKKGFDKPLIETSLMLNSVDFVVKKGGSAE